MKRITILALALTAFGCRTTDASQTMNAGDAGDHACKIVNTDMTFVAPQGGYTGGRITFAVANDVPSDIVKLQICVNCQRQANGDVPANQPWQTVDAQAMSGSAQYNYFTATFDLGSNAGNPNIWLNYVGFAVVPSGRMFDNNMTTGTSIRVDGYHGRSAAELRSGAYGGHCGAAFDQQAQARQAIDVCGALHTTLIGGQPDDGSPERFYGGNIVDATTQQSYAIQYKGRGALSGDYCVHGSLSVGDAHLIDDVISVTPH